MNGRATRQGSDAHGDKDIRLTSVWAPPNLWDASLGGVTCTYGDGSARRSPRNGKGARGTGSSWAMLFVWRSTHPHLVAPLVRRRAAGRGGGATCDWERVLRVAPPRGGSRRRRPPARPAPLARPGRRRGRLPGLPAAPRALPIRGRRGVRGSIFPPGERTGSTSGPVSSVAGSFAASGGRSPAGTRSPSDLSSSSCSSHPSGFRSGVPSPTRHLAPARRLAWPSGRETTAPAAWSPGSRICTTPTTPPRSVAGRGATRFRT